MQNSLIGSTFGRLSVIKKHSGGKNSIWECLCECGNTAFVSTPNLKSGNTRSCGCLNQELSASRNSTHGHSKGYRPSKLYNTWLLMLKRCNNPSDKRYSDYGGRGIKVCEEWTKFENFARDMGEPEKNLTLDRIDNNIGYCKENCRWANRITQSRNKRSNYLITYGDETKPLVEWSEITGIKPDTISARIKRYGWPINKALGFA